jgi:hypothetical protein
MRLAAFNADWLRQNDVIAAWSQAQAFDFICWPTAATSLIRPTNALPQTLCRHCSLSGKRLISGLWRRYFDSDFLDQLFGRGDTQTFESDIEDVASATRFKMPPCCFVKRADAQSSVNPPADRTKTAANVLAFEV